LFCELKPWICYASEGSSIFSKKYGALFTISLTFILSLCCHKCKKYWTWWVMLKWSDTFRLKNWLKNFVSYGVVNLDFLVKIFKTFRNYLIENYHVQAPGYTWVETWHILECMCKKCKQILQAYSLMCTDYTIETLLFAVSVKKCKNNTGLFLDVYCWYRS